MTDANNAAIVPRDDDILFGRGGTIACHPGNLRLRALVRQCKPQFDRCPRVHKRDLAAAIVDQIERGGGRFLAEDPDAVSAKASSISERRWVKVDRERSEEKVMHRLREKDKGVPMDMMGAGDSGLGMEVGNNPFLGGLPSGNAVAAGGLAPEALASIITHDVRNDFDATAEAGNMILQQQSVGSQQLINGQPALDANQLQQLQSQLQADNVNTMDGLGMQQPISSQQMMQNDLPGNMNVQRQSAGNQQYINDQPALDANQLQQLQSQLQSGVPMGNNNVMNDLGNMGAQELLAGMSSLLNQAGDANLSGSPGGMGMQQSMGISLPSSNGPSPDLSGQQPFDLGNIDPTGYSIGMQQQSVGPAHVNWTTGSLGIQQQPLGGGPSLQQMHSPALQSHSSDSAAIQSPSETSSPLYPLNSGMGRMESVSSGFGAAPIGIDEWMQTAGEVSSKTDYVHGALDLGWAIANHLNDLIETGMAVSPGDVSSKNLLIFMELPDPASYAIRPAIREVQIQAARSDGGARRNQAGSPREVCASLGQILLELFSMNQSSSMDFSSQRTQENDETQQLQKRQATARSPKSLISSKANNLLLGLVMPASINRLVCDLLDAADEACPSTALTTLEEALEDLTQMRSDPASFLFDRTSPEEALRHFHSPDECLFGREKELTALMKAKGNISTSVLGDGRSFVGQGNGFICEAAFVGGYAGSGKSSLLLPLVPACNKEQWFVLSCKFDKQAAPVKVLYSALDDFFATWGDGSDSNFNPALMGSFREVCECICSTIDDDGFHQLSELVPNFTKMYPQLVKRTSSPDQVVVSSMDKVGSAKRRLQNLIHVLFKSLCSAGRPVLLVLDDLQWCDSFVLEGLTEFIVSYIHSEAGASNIRRRRGLMLAGTYRSNEVAGGHPFIESINCLENSQKANITMLTAGELSETDVTRLISAKLCLPWRYTQELAGVVHIKTRGNPFFVNQFLRSIVSNKMLEFSVKSRRWVWDCDVVEMQMISDGVAELLTSSFNQLPEALMQAMKIVSCLGYQVERSTIDALDSNHEVMPFDMGDELHLAVKEGILEKAGPVYQFTHDIVQQTIYELIPPGDRKALHKLIGQSLLKTARRRPTMHLLAVDQINIFCKDNEGIVLSPEERSQFAHSNAQAAKYAISSSSFEQARSYVDAGIRLLESNHWETQYSLSMNLFEMSASVSCISGDISTMNTCLRAILSHVMTFEDSLKASSMLAKLLASNSKYDDATSNCLDILKNLGEDFPSEVSPPLVQQELPDLLIILRNITYDQIKALPAMTDKTKLNAMKFLNMLCMYCVVSKPLLLPFLSRRMVQLTLEDGFCEDSIVGLAIAGFSVYFFTEDLQLAFHLGKVSELLVEESPKKHILRARLCMYLYATLKILREPWPSVVTLYPELYKSAMFAGDVENALICRWNYSSVGYWAGALKIPTISEQSLLLMKEAAKYQQNIVLYGNMAIIQSCIHLSGRSSNEVEIKSLDELNDIGMKTNSHLLIYQVFMHKMSNLFWSREFLAAAELSENYSEKHDPALQQKRVLHVLRVFYEGVTYLNLARGPSDAQKWRDMGEKAVATVAGYATSMSKWNFENKCLLLQAELHYLNGDLMSADAMYEASIKSAHAHKFRNEEALAYELHGRFCVENLMAKKGSNQLRVAIGKFKEWGATKKANDVQLYLDSVIV